MKKPAKNEKVIATLELIVEYESIPDQHEIEQLIEKAREYGGPIKADLTIHKSYKTSLL